MWLNDIQLDTLSEDQRAAVRNQHVGFIFQNFQLLPTLTALENVLVPLELRGSERSSQNRPGPAGARGPGRARPPLPGPAVGRRAAARILARAFANRPKMLFADEPTGNLDPDTSATVVDLLFELNREAGTTLVLVTHDLELAARTQRIMRMKGGTVVDPN